MCRTIAKLTVLLAVLPLATAEPPPRTMLGMPLLFSDDFESGKAERWQPGDANAWRIIKQGDSHVLNQFQQSKVQTPVRSPFNRSLVKDLVVSDFVLECRVQSTVKDYGHRDLCLFFGYQDASHMYYVHLGKEADPHAHSVFIVNAAPRLSIAKTRTKGINWDDGWHTVRIVRSTETGDITVFFDDMKTSIMTAQDKTFAWGQVGVGSFDDTGNFDDVRVWGKTRGKE